MGAGQSVNSCGTLTGEEMTVKYMDEIYGNYVHDLSRYKQKEVHDRHDQHSPYRGTKYVVETVDLSRCCGPVSLFGGSSLVMKT